MNFAVGTAGMGVWLTSDFGQTWSRPIEGMYSEGRIWSVLPGPSCDGLLAGSDLGIYHLSSNNRWALLASFGPSTCIWSMVRSRLRRTVLFAGTQYPCAIYRSGDDGKKWRLVADNLPQQCEPVIHPRVTSLVFGPREESLWAGVEAAGIFASWDGGETWAHVSSEMPTQDIHCLYWSHGAESHLYAATNIGLFVSADFGVRWKHVPLVSPHPYVRSIASANDGATIYVTNGGGPPGSWGKMFRTTDKGKTFAEVAIGDNVNSTFWVVEPHPYDSDKIFACTVLGQIWRTADAGQSWERLARELGEIRSATWFL